MEHPVWERGCGDGLGETMSFMYDPVREVRGACVRIWVENSTRRVLGHGESEDMKSWSGPRFTFEADDRWGFGAQVYSLSAWYDEGVYRALANMYFTDLHPDPRLQQTMRPYLLCSNDALNWEPVDASRPFIRLGEAGQWDAAMIGGATPSSETIGCCSTTRDTGSRTRAHASPMQTSSAGAWGWPSADEAEPWVCGTIPAKKRP
jgi:hypothetical protein